MAISTLLSFMIKNPITLMVRITKTTKELYRAGFVATAISEGMYDLLAHGPVSLDALAGHLGLGAEGNREGLVAWLDLGVSLGELSRSDEGYSIKSAFSRDLMRESNDTWRAFFLARVEIFYDYILRTPSYLREQKRFEFDESYGELFARSSRTVEPLLLDVVDDIIPQKGEHSLLEVGCGSGVYMKRACERNAKLTATGIEMQKSVADFAAKNMKTWNFDDRVEIIHSDIRAYQSDRRFDTITFHNLVYYFPVKERTQALRFLGEFLNPGGRLIVTTLCQGNDPSITTMNLWSSMTVGCGPLPEPGQMFNHLDEAGFRNIQSEKLIPSFYLFRAGKSA